MVDKARLYLVTNNPQFLLVLHNEVYFSLTVYICHKVAWDLLLDIPFQSQADEPAVIIGHHESGKRFGKSTISSFQKKIKFYIGEQLIYNLMLIQVYSKVIQLYLLFSDSFHI